MPSTKINIKQILVFRICVYHVAVTVHYEETSSNLCLISTPFKQRLLIYFTPSNQHWFCLVSSCKLAMYVDCFSKIDVFRCLKTLSVNGRCFGLISYWMEYSTITSNRLTNTTKH